MGRTQFIAQAYHSLAESNCEGYLALALDDPISQAENLIASDERQEPIGLAKNLAEVAALLPPVSAVLGPFPGLISKWLSRHREENRDYMVTVLKNEVKRLRIDVDGLSEEQKTFYDKDYVPLVLDGLKKFEDLRAKERIARIAKILAYAAEQGPTRSVPRHNSGRSERL